MTENTPEEDAVTVLVVEDEQDLADLYATWLNDRYTVQTAYNGDEALSTLDSDVDVVLLDRRMPGVSGDDVLEHIREQDLDIRVAVVSAVNPDFDVIGMGFDDYLVKPVDSDELHTTVERMRTRATYDETVQELQQLAATKAALEAEKSEQDLEAHTKYQELTERIDTLQSEAAAVVEDFEEDDFEATFRDLDSTPQQTDQGGD